MGNLASNSAGASFSYKSKNQTISITDKGTTPSGLTYSDVGQTQRTAAGSTSYANGAQGILASTNGSTTTYYLRDASGNLLGERVGSSHYYYYLQGGIESVTAVITGTGAIENRYGYDPYGKSTSKSEAVANPWRYAGGYLDPTGLYKFGTRYYDPNRGAWTQPDPAAIADGGYVYAADDPINLTDPSGGYAGPGQSWFGAFWAIGIGVTATISCGLAFVLSIV